jgi:hypothetical protein
VLSSVLIITAVWFLEATEALKLIPTFSDIGLIEISDYMYGEFYRVAQSRAFGQVSDIIRVYMYVYLYLFIYMRLRCLV